VKTASSPLVSALEILARSAEEPMATLAEALIPVGNDASTSIDSKNYSHIKEIMSSLAMGLVASGESPSRIVEALIRIDAYLVDRGVSSMPFAARLAPLAAECAIHAESASVRDTIVREIIRQAPVFTIKKTLYAAPMAAMGAEGLSLFSDRVLLAVLKARPKKVVLLLLEEHPPRDTIARLVDALEADLTAQRVEVKKVFALQ
jgi:hypothetical protein